jgi:hypothetical protein
MENSVEYINNLPDLIRLALIDNEFCHRESIYKKGPWRSPHVYDNLLKKCKINFIGAILAKTLHVNPKQNYSLDNLKTNPIIFQKLRILDLLLDRKYIQDKITYRLCELGWINWDLKLSNIIQNNKIDLKKIKTGTIPEWEKLHNLLKQ